jgi:hypothetical protein
MFQSSLKEAQAFQELYLPNTGSYYRDNRNYSYDLKNNRNTTSLLSPYDIDCYQKKTLLKKLCLSTHLLKQKNSFKKFIGEPTGRDG